MLKYKNKVTKIEANRNFNRYMDTYARPKSHWVGKVEPPTIGGHFKPYRIDTNFDKEHNFMLTRLPLMEKSF